MFGTVAGHRDEQQERDAHDDRAGANFSGVDGWRSPSLVQIAANTPDRMMMNTGLIDCTQLTGISQPKMSRFSCLSE